MERSHFRTTLAVVLLACALAPAAAAQDAKFEKAKFTGWQSCGSTGCHGGGVNHNESLIFVQRDRHYETGGMLEKGRSRIIMESLGLKAEDATKGDTCLKCHAPMGIVAAERLEKGVVRDAFVACESCHGAAEPWLRFHTRADVNYAQVVALGMRDLIDLYGRANACVACHENIDEALVTATHPQLLFELDGQVERQKPHYKDSRPGLGPRSWLTGQAVALRETSAKFLELAKKKKEIEKDMVPRWQALVWLLGKTDAGRKELPQGQDYAAMKDAADRLAKTAAVGTWTKDSIAKLLAEYAALGPEFAAGKPEQIEFRHRAEVLAPAMTRLWLALQKPGTGGAAPSTESSAGIKDLIKYAAAGDDFKPSDFGDALGRFQVEFGRKQ